jgi:hypothetical protein
MPATARAPRSRPNHARAWPGDQVTAGGGAAAAGPAPTQERTGGMPAEVTEHLRRHPVITLATTSFTEMPHPDTVAYASDCDSIFSVVGEGTPLLRNIHDPRRVSFTIDDYTAGWAKVCELQGVGRCQSATAAQHAAAWPLYLAKFGPGTARPPGQLHTIVPSELTSWTTTTPPRPGRPPRPAAPFRPRTPAFNPPAHNAA